MSTLILHISRTKEIDYKDMTLHQRINYKSFRYLRQSKFPHSDKNILLGFQKYVKEWGGCICQYKNCESLKLPNQF